MNRRERRIRELSVLLKEQPMLTIRKMAEQLGVSEMTIHRDLKYLEECENGAVPADDPGYDIQQEEIRYHAEKDRIARFAVSLMEPGDVVIIDSGTSASAMAKYVPEDKELTVIGYNFRVMSDLCVKRGVRVIFAGGQFHSSDLMFESPKGIELIQSHRANKLFLSASGIHDKLGLTCAHNYEVMTKQAAIGSSLQKILLADSSKFGIVRTAFFAGMEELDAIITDDGISEEWKQIIRELEIKLYIIAEDGSLCEQSGDMI